MKNYVALLSITLLLHFSHGSKPRQGKFTATLSNYGQNQRLPVSTGFYLNSSIILTLRPEPGCNLNSMADVCWVARGLDCKYDVTEDVGIRSFMTYPWMQQMNHTGMYASNCANKDTSHAPIEVKCSKKVSTIKEFKYNQWKYIDGTPTQEQSLTHGLRKRDAEEPDSKEANLAEIPESNKSPLSNTEASESEKSSLSNTEASEPSEDASDKTVVSQVVDEDSANAPAPAVSTDSVVPAKNTLTKVPMEGFYYVIVWLKEVTNQEEELKVDVTLELKNPFNGYLSAYDYPLLNFYMAMCILYAFYAAAWLVMSACHYRDLLRVQFWIGGVILLGMIEKAVLYAEYKNVDDTGISLMGAAKFADVVSSIKRALARMLVIIISLGFGIVKPRLGPMLHRVVACGVLYFTFAVIDEFSKHDLETGEGSSFQLMYTFIPLAIIDSIICWWVLISLLTTMKTLRLRRNVVKLSLYKHFFHTIILCVLLSLGLMFWSYRNHNQACIDNWAALWLEVALWHVLFSFILLVIMILWRPNANNQIYAYSPMIDGNDSDEDNVEEPMLGSGATENMKLRSINRQEDDNGKDVVDAAEADLKWIDENIPQTLADSALPILVDSDDDVRDTKLEMSKIE